MRRRFDQLEYSAGLFRAFAEPSQLAIIHHELEDGELSVSEIVDLLPTSQANVSKRLKLLNEAGVVSRRKQGTQVIYSVSDTMVFELCSLVCDKLNRDIRKLAKIKS